MRQQASQLVFGDESGFTGNNLLDPDQEYFAYCVVAVGEDEAANLVSRIKRDYGIQGDELKGRRLVRFHRGRKAIGELYESLADRTRLIVSHKRYALAGKFFEYVFEPPLAKKNSFFYALDFHRFIANLLFAHYFAEAPHLAVLFEEFEAMMRARDVDEARLLFTTLAIPNENPMIADIRDFAVSHRESIAAELAAMGGATRANWVLDLTTTSAVSVLAELGERFDPMRVVVDESKPLRHDAPLFEAMIGRSDVAEVEIGDRRERLSFNLERPIELAGSHEHPGLQLADALATGGLYFFQDRERPGREWREQHLERVLSTRSVLPDLSCVDPRNPKAVRNATVLAELAERSRTGEDLLEGLDRVLGLAQSASEAILRPRQED